eukprot:Blabericola_migrator_1__4924@NODE_256_length_10795_cov_202_211130_g214_i0_p4_GENE_NODE_256_length_10795_cov_202_211130_g214_i0NODE_256_length_10795_cov_202_211130_g214_i0_p4_ORF_typecomplete_len305_score31_11DUF3682/PF12446_8/0_11DUF3682/PF12446_8/6_5e03DUF3682/PF12446_8/9_6e03_NODE_256_length_10795_cov_202_211130_g214_i063047218
MRHIRLFIASQHVIASATILFPTPQHLLVSNVTGNGIDYDSSLAYAYRRPLNLPQYVHQVVTPLGVSQRNASKQSSLQSTWGSNGTYNVTKVVAEGVRNVSTPSAAAADGSSVPSIARRPIIPISSPYLLRQPSATFIPSIGGNYMLRSRHGVALPTPPPYPFGRIAAIPHSVNVTAAEPRAEAGDKGLAAAGSGVILQDMTTVEVEAAAEGEQPENAVASYPIIISAAAVVPLGLVGAGYAYYLKKKATEQSQIPRNEMRSTAPGTDDDDTSFGDETEDAFESKFEVGSDAVMWANQADFSAF